MLTVFTIMAGRSLLPKAGWSLSRAMHDTAAPTVRVALVDDINRRFAVPHHLLEDRTRRSIVELSLDGLFDDTHERPLSLPPGLVRLELKAFQARWPPHLERLVYWAKSEPEDAPPFLDTDRLPSTLKRLELNGCSVCTRVPRTLQTLRGSDDCKLMVWNAELSQRLETINSGHVNNIFGARFLPHKGNNEIVSCAADGQVRHTVISAATTRNLARHEGMAHRVVLDPLCPAALFTAGEDGRVYHFDMRTPGRKAQVFSMLDDPDPRHGVALFGLAAHPQQPYIFFGGESADLHMLDTRAAGESGGGGAAAAAARARGAVFRPPADQLDLGDATVTGVAVNWCGSEALVTLNDGCVFRLDVSAGAQAGGAGGGGGGAAEGAGGGGGRRRARFAEHEGALGRYEGHRNKRGGDAQRVPRSLSAAVPRSCGEQRGDAAPAAAPVSFFGPRSEYVVSGSDCGHVFIWDTGTGALVNLLKATLSLLLLDTQRTHGDRVGAVNCLEPHPFLPVLATSGLEHDAKIWRPTAARPADARALTGWANVTAEKLCARNNAGRRGELRTRRARHHDRALASLLTFHASSAEERLMLQVLIARAAMGMEDSDDDDSDGNGGGGGGARGGGGAGDGEEGSSDGGGGGRGGGRRGGGGSAGALSDSVAFMDSSSEDGGGGDGSSSSSSSSDDDGEGIGGDGHDQHGGSSSSADGMDADSDSGFEEDIMGHMRAAASGEFGGNSSEDSDEVLSSAGSGGGASGSGGGGIEDGSGASDSDSDSELSDAGIE
ncbi:WD40-repeat-containing domain protein [Tribonema minus]|uniref:WD40-repeat-containing domain protein n=1 Tax=Tribonema minus TaxID=303371 RepID=A0A836CJI5_9STRA|nr:WD40-repeat-containing domain protein [Tribonema minus]